MVSIYAYYIIDATSVVAAALDFFVLEAGDLSAPVWGSWPAEAVPSPSLVSTACTQEKNINKQPNYLYKLDDNSK